MVGCSMTVDIDKERYNAFLKELTKITKKHKIAIGGCGCCGSPYLVSVEKSKGTRYTHDGEFGEVLWSE
jgi:hypothetical protein